MIEKSVNIQDVMVEVSFYQMNCCLVKDPPVSPLKNDRETEEEKTSLWSLRPCASSQGLV